MGAVEARKQKAEGRRQISVRLLRTAYCVATAILALVVLWIGYSASSQRRYGALNGITGEITAGQSVGQIFVARYDRLSSVEVRIATYGRMSDPTRAGLVMRLRSSPGSKEDIATVSLPPPVVLEENGWYRFSFAPIEGSRGKSYYAEVASPDGTIENGLALYWFKADGRGDPYRDGTAYLDGKPASADLTFGLGYSASPLEIWRGMLGSTAANSSSVAVGTLLVLAAGGIVWAVVWLPSIFRDPERRKRWLLRWSLPVSLAAALLYGLLFILIVPPWQGPDEYSHFAYAVLLDRHNLDDRQVKALDLDFKDRDNALVAAVNASADRHDFTRLFAGSAAPGAPTDVGFTIFQQNRQPATYYWLCAVGLRVARALGAPADPYANPEAALTATRLVSLLLGLTAVVLAWMAGLLLRAPYSSDPWLMLVLPLTVGLLPMHTFMATVVNNDILAEVAVSALFVAEVALLRWPSGLRGLGLAALAVVLTVAGMQTKSTALAASLPLLASGLLVWVGMLTLRRWAAPDRRPRMVAALCVLVAAMLVLIVPLAYEREEGSATGWFGSFDPLQRAARVQSDTAHQGSYVIQPGEANGNMAVEDIVPSLIYHPALDVTFSGWARLAPGQPVTATQVVTAELAVLEGDRIAGVSGAALNPSTGWVRLSVVGSVSASAERVRLRLASSGGRVTVQFDDMALQVQGHGAAWNDPIYRAALVDPSGEEPPLVLRGIVRRLVPGEVSDMADALANPQPFDKGALWRDYAYYQYRTFWGSFGWLTIYLPELFYTLLDLLIVAALAGLVLRVIRRREWPHIWVGLVSFVALAVAVFIGFAKQMSLLAYSGLPAYPQGRYLLVLSIPIAWLLLGGLGEVWRLVFKRSLRLFGKSAGTQYEISNAQYGASLWLWGSVLLFFAAYSLFALILPFYYG